jgi:hypothetical protein
MVILLDRGFPDSLRLTAAAGLSGDSTTLCSRLEDEPNGFVLQHDLFVLRLADVGGMEDVQSLRAGGHEAALDPIVGHLDEVAGAAGAAMQVASLRTNSLSEFVPTAPSSTRACTALGWIS